MSEQAGRDWDTVWQRWQPQRELWPPEKPVVDLAARLKAEGRTRVHDLGCGMGRHLILFASEGFEASGSDISPAAVEASRANLRKAGVDATVSLCDMRSIPEEDASLDALIAWDVLFHADMAGIRDALEEIRRTLRDGGYLLATFNFREYPKYARYRAAVASGIAREIEPDTFIMHDGESDMLVPHHYMTKPELLATLNGFTFDIIALEQLPDAPGKWWVLARKE